MSKKILFTANKELSAPLLEKINTDSLLHLPLEQYSLAIDEELGEKMKESFQNFTFIIYGNLRNARHFMDWVIEHSMKEKVQNCINLVIDKPTADFLEENNIPAILPKQYGKPIDVMEFMLRISKEGTTLYPTVENKIEEMPALLQELDMPVVEFPVSKEVSLPDHTLADFRDRVKKNQFDIILFHSRSSITRVKTAFPDLDLSKHKFIAGSPGVAEKLRSVGYEPISEANGSWYSIAQVIEEVLA